MTITHVWVLLALPVSYAQQGQCNDRVSVRLSVQSFDCSCGEWWVCYWVPWRQEIFGGLVTQQQWCCSVGHGTAFSSKCRQYHDDSHIEEAQLRLVVTIVAVCLFTVGGGSVHLSCATCWWRSWVHRQGKIILLISFIALHVHFLFFLYFCIFTLQLHSWFCAFFGICNTCV